MTLFVFLTIVGRTILTGWSKPSNSYAVYARLIYTKKAKNYPMIIFLSIPKLIVQASPPGSSCDGSSGT